MTIDHPEHGGLFSKPLPEDASALNRPQFLKYGRGQAQRALSLRRTMLLWGSGKKRSILVPFRKLEEMVTALKRDPHARTLLKKAF